MRNMIPLIFFPVIAAVPILSSAGIVADHMGYDPFVGQSLRIASLLLALVYCVACVYYRCRK